MNISIRSLLEGATRATGSVAVIDVIRAFTTAAVALANGASKTVMVHRGRRGTGASASGTGEICMGECSRPSTRSVRFWKLALRDLKQRFRWHDNYSRRMQVQ